MKILITGAAGFIGFHLSRRLLKDNHQIVGLDNFNDYYDVNLKKDRIKLIDSNPNFKLVKINLEDSEAINSLFTEEKFDAVVNLAAQAGVRYSIENPRAYIDSNMIGFFNLLENCRHNKVGHLLYASSSSVYGLNKTEPFSVTDNVDHPISLYAATKKSNELMAHTYSHLFGLPTTGLRFFTVYGPWGRPDMALAKFSRAIHHDEPLMLFNYGDMQRDFTYVDDIVEGITKLIPVIPEGNPDWDGKNPDPSSSLAPYRLHNIGAGNPVRLDTYLHYIEEYLGKKAIVKRVEMQPGDVPSTSSNVDSLHEATGYKPSIKVKEGIKAYVEWFREYYLEGNRPIPKM